MVEHLQKCALHVFVHASVSPLLVLQEDVDAYASSVFPEYVFGAVKALVVSFARLQSLFSSNLLDQFLVLQELFLVVLHASGSGD
jgi:hypothetical protein